MEIHNSTSADWFNIAKSVGLGKFQASPRGLPTFEWLNATLMFDYPQFNYINPKGRKLNLPFAIMDFADVMLGMNPGYSHLLNSRMNQFINVETKEYDGGYGSRLWLRRPGRMTKDNQFVRCLDELDKDKDSRRAVITIHNPLLENWEGVDIACTLSLQFIIRENRLNLIATMRSEDVYLGFCYDTMHFQLMQLCMASILGVEIGRYCHNVGSLHLYESDEAKLNEIDNRSNPYDHHITPTIPQVKTYDDLISNLVCISQLIQLLDDQDSFEDASKTLQNVKDPYFANCAHVVFVDILRRNGQLDLAKEFTKPLNNTEFSDYFGERYNW